MLAPVTVATMRLGHDSMRTRKQLVNDSTVVVILTPGIALVALFAH